MIDAVATLAAVWDRGMASIVEQTRDTMIQNRECFGGWDPRSACRRDLRMRLLD